MEYTCLGQNSGPINCPIQTPPCLTGGTAGGGIMIIICESVFGGQLEWRQQQPNFSQPPPPPPILGPPYCTAGTQGTCTCKYNM